MSYQLVDQLQKKAIPVAHSCRVLSVSRSGYYAARRRPAKPVLCKAGVHLKAAFAAILKVEVDAWQLQRNADRRGILWLFTRQDADEKMARHYVS